MASGLLDFGTGGLAGAGAGFQVGSKFGPMGGLYGAGVGLAAGGLLSFFGGAEDRRLTSKANAQSLELGEMQITEARRQERLARERARKQRAFSQAFGSYFKNKAQAA